MPTYTPYSYHFFRIRYNKETVEQHENTALLTGDVNHFMVCFMMKKFFGHENIKERRDLIKILCSLPRHER